MRRSLPRDLAHALGDALGQWRTQLVLRGYGLCVFLITLHQYHWNVQTQRRSLAWSWEVVQRHLASRPSEEHWVSLAAVVLLVAGARGAVLLFSAVSMTLLVRRNMAEPWLFPAVEYVLFAMLPWLAVAVIAGEWLRSALTRTPFDLRAPHVDRTMMRCLRMAFLTTMGFVTLHKLNSDFMNPATSCEHVITGWLGENWGRWGRALAELGSPALTVGLEGGIPLLVLGAPLTGIILVSGFMFVLALVGAPSTAGIVMVLSWAFFSPEHGPALQRRWRTVLALAAPLVVVVSAALLASYQGTALSREMIVLIVVLAVGPVACALVLLWSENPPSPIDVVPPPHSGWLLLGAPALATALFLANGMAPYLGLRFNYSFAMWSNLRVDQQRWNSWLVPSWVQRYPTSAAFIDVQSVTPVPLVLSPFRDQQVPLPQFVETVAPLTTRDDVRVDADVTWNGQRHTSAGVAELPQLVALLAAMRQDPNPGAHPVDIASFSVTVDPTGSDAPNDSPYELQLEPALFSPSGFRRALERTARQHRNFTLDFAYRGVSHHVPGTLADDAFRRFVMALQEDNLFPPKLSRAGAQRCFH